MRIYRVLKFILQSVTAGLAAAFVILLLNIFCLPEVPLARGIAFILQLVTYGVT